MRRWAASSTWGPPPLRTTSASSNVSSSFAASRNRRASMTLPEPSQRNCRQNDQHRLHPQTIFSGRDRSADQEERGKQDNHTRGHPRQTAPQHDQSSCSKQQHGQQPPEN